MAKKPFLPLSYLACPYTHPDPRMLTWRFDAATRAAAALMNTQKWNVLSPITHSHPLHVTGGMRGDWEFWKTIDTEFLQCSCRIVVLCIPGWAESTGVKAELKIARDLGIEILFMSLPITEPLAVGDGTEITYKLSPCFYDL